MSEGTETGVLALIVRNADGVNEKRRYCAGCGKSCARGGRLMIAHWVKNGKSGYLYRCSKCGKLMEAEYDEKNDPVGGWDKDKDVETEGEKKGNERNE